MGRMDWSKKKTFYEGQLLSLEFPAFLVQGLLEDRFLFPCQLMFDFCHLYKYNVKSHRRGNGYFQLFYQHKKDARALIFLVIDIYNCGFVFNTGH